MFVGSNITTDSLPVGIFIIEHLLNNKVWSSFVRKIMDNLLKFGYLPTITDF